jgi:dipeptidyl aminopeptidase/acylaminoacyl peptidase
MTRWILSLLILAAVAPPALRAAPLESYGQLPSISDVEISPDGHRLAYAADVKGKRAIIVQTIIAPSSASALNLKDSKLRSLHWANSNWLLIMTSREEERDAIMGVRSPAREWFLTEAYDVSTGKQHTLLAGVPNTMNVTYSEAQSRAVNGRTKLFVQGVYFENHQGERALFAVDLESNATTLMFHRSDAINWFIDGSGNVVAETDYNESRERWSVRLRRADEWNEAYAVDTPIDHPRVMGISADGGSLIVTQAENGRVESRLLSLATGTWGPNLEHPLLAAIEDPLSHRIVGGVHETAVRTYTFFDPDLQSAWETVEKLFPNEDVRLESYADDRNLLVVQVAGLPDGYAHYLVNRRRGGAVFIGNAYTGLTADDLAPVKTITYRAADGLEIPAYLTLPKNREAKDLPLVVLPHGGPAARDEPGFDWWSQALASRGYAVLQPEFRGSAGISPNLLTQGYGQWGRKMQTDLSDGVRMLVTDGIIDPRRVCIVGASYGGYAALAGVAFDTGVYRCAVSVAGVSNLHDMLVWVRENQSRSDSSTMRFWDRFLGARDMDDPVLNALSPVKHADAITAPLLLIHGHDDTVVPIDQSKQMAEAMKRAHKPVEFVELRSEDHWLSRSETRMQMLDATVKFLEANNPPG